MNHDATTSLGPVILIAAVASGLVGGVFFAFSTFIMPALDRLGPTQGIAAMQSINVTVLTPWFMVVLFGNALLCLGLGVAAVVRWDDPGARYQLLGAVAYFAGIVLTAVYHVPRNDALAALDPGSAGAAAEWASYVAGWTAWNHVRAFTSLAAAVLLTIACRA